MFKSILNNFYAIKKDLNQKGSGILNNISLKVNLQENLPDDFDFKNLKKDISSDFECSEFDVKITYEDKTVTINFISEIIDNNIITEKISELFKNLNVKDVGSIITNESTDKSLTSLIKKAEQLKNAPKLQIDLDKTKLKLDELKKITDILGETNVEEFINLSRINNAFIDFTAQLDRTTKNYEISKKNMPIIIKPPLEDNSGEYHSAYGEILDSLDKLNPNVDEPENLDQVINELSKKMNNLKEKKNTLEKECEEVKKKYKELSDKSVFEEYFQKQREINKKEGKVLYREIGTNTFEFGDSKQDIVFYNGTKEELANDTSKPIQSYDNSFKEKVDTEKIDNNLKELLAGIDFEASYPTLESFYQDNASKRPQTAGFESFKVNYTGGFETGKNMKEISENLASIRSYLLEFQKKNAECQKVKYDFNLLFIQNTFYHLYMINSIKKVILTDTQLLYSLLTVGNCQYYLNIINTILTRIENKKIGINERYFQKYHFLLLKNLKSLFTFIVYLSRKNNQMNFASNTSQSVIDINNCRGIARDLLASFNSFKDILDAYKNESLPPVSVFVRINDWPQDNRPNKKGQNSELGYNNKVIDQRDTNEIIFSKNEDDSRLLDIGFVNCGNIDHRLGLAKGSAKNDFFNGDSLVKKYNPIKQIKVADVLPSIDIPTNESLNKYMGISSKLSQGKDTMMITSGYSGTGKTFSLFGGGGHPGLLQSTLSEIQGVETIYFRVFEIYALGIQYPFYWEKKDKIYQKLYTYKLKIEKNKLDVDEVEELSKFEDIKDYIGKVSKVKSGSDTNYNSYTEINYEQYKNFSDFIDIIDAYRQKTEDPSNQDSSYPQRIKKTSNNPASSRSILVYEFIMKTKSGNTLLIMVDLPGLEDVEATYILDDKFSVPGDNKNLIGAALLANPLFAPLYKAQYTNAIESFIEDIKGAESEIITGWLDEVSLNLTYNSKTRVYAAVAEPISKYFKETGKIDFEGDKSPARTAWKGSKNNTELYKGPGKMQGDIQRKNNGYFYFILHLIKEGRIDLIVKLMTKLVETEEKIVNEKGEKKDPNIKNLYEENKKGTTDYKSLEEKIMQSYEGIAINENILGLIYLIVSQVTEEKNGKVFYKNASHQIKSQIDIADLEHSDKFRMKKGEYNFDSNEDNKKYIETYKGTAYFKENAGEILVRQSRGVNKKTEWEGDNVKLAKLDIDDLYSKSVKDYDHTKIFTVKQKESEQEPFITEEEMKKRKDENNFPLIWYYLEPYFNSIKNIQLLLLLTNNDPQKKCFAQINYLLDSISFIEALDPDQ